MITFACSPLVTHLAKIYVRLDLFLINYMRNAVDVCIYSIFFRHSQTLTVFISISTYFATGENF